LIFCVNPVYLVLSVTVQELEREHPGIFGQNGGKSRAISLVIMSWTFGTFLGPVVTGALTEKLGYSTMNNMLGKTSSPTTNRSEGTKLTIFRNYLFPLCCKLFLEYSWEVGTCFRKCCGTANLLSNDQSPFLANNQVRQPKMLWNNRPILVNSTISTVKSHINPLVEGNNS